ncbi:hypothetical protein D3C75_1337530 [compost metagenome]
MGIDSGQDVEAVGVADVQALFAQKQLGGQVWVGLSIWRRTVIDLGLIGRGLQV